MWRSRPKGNLAKGHVGQVTHVGKVAHAGHASLILVLALVLVLSATTLLAGCSATGETGGGQKGGTQWTKVADGVYIPVHQEGPREEDRLLLQRQMTGGEQGAIYSLNLEKGGRADRLKLEIDLPAYISAATEMIAKEMKAEGEDNQPYAAPYFNEKAMELVLDTGGKIWSYGLETGELKLLLPDTYDGKTLEQLYEEAEAVWGGREHYVLTFFEMPRFSADGAYMVYSSNKDCTTTGGSSLFAYEFKELKEFKLMEGKSGQDNLCWGWVNDHLLVGQSYNQDSLEESYYLLDIDGNTKPLKLSVKEQESVRILETRDGKILYTVWNDANGDSTYSADEVKLTAVAINEKGKAEQLFSVDYSDTWMSGTEALSPDKTRVACVSRKDAYSYERNVSIKNCSSVKSEDAGAGAAKDGEGERTILPPNIGNGIETGIADVLWMDDNQLLVNVREEWNDQTTYSMWVLDLRAEDGGEPAIPSVTRDDATMAEAYMTVIDYLYGKDEGLNGKAGELKYIALDTQDMLWLTENQKALLLQSIAEKYGVEVLDKTYVQLKAEGYLETADYDTGYFADGMLFKITGGYFDNNMIRLEEAFKWRSGTGAYGTKELVLEFKEEGWSIMDTGADWIS